MNQSAKKALPWALGGVALIAGVSVLSKRASAAPPPDHQVKPGSLNQIIAMTLKERGDILSNIGRAIESLNPGTRVAMIARDLGKAITAKDLPAAVFEPGTNKAYTLLVDVLLKQENDPVMLKRWMAEMAKFPGGMPRSQATLNAKLKRLGA